MNFPPKCNKEIHHVEFTFRILFRTIVFIYLLARARWRLKNPKCKKGKT